MKHYLLILTIIAFAWSANAQEGAAQEKPVQEAPAQGKPAQEKPAKTKTCFDEYYEAFTTRGALPVPDGVQNVVIALRTDTGCYCGEGRITIKNGEIIPTLMVKKVDGTYEMAKRELFHKAITGHEVAQQRYTVYKGMSETFSTKDFDYVNLFFIDFLKRKVVANTKAPSPNDIEGKQIELNVKEKEIIKRAFEGLQFENGKSDIKSSSFPHLNLLATMLTDKPDYKLTINGYTDNVGKPESNLILSRNRSEAVKDYLIKQGVEANRISTDGFGMGNPVADNNTAAGRAKNRRVEFIVTQ